MFFKKIIFSVFLLFGVFCMAQNNIDYSNYIYNPSFINPSFSGQKEHKELFLNSRIQWIGVGESPKTHSLMFQMPLENNLGIGFNIVNDKLFIFNETTFALDASYKLKVTDNHDFKFGIRAEGNLYSGDLSKITTREANDDAFSQTKPAFSPNFSFGGSFNHKDYFMHLAFHKILKEKRNTNLNYSDKSNSRYVLFGGGYTFQLNKDLELMPSTLFKLHQGSTLDFDLNTRIRYKKKYNVGLSYFWNNSFQVSGLFDVVDWAKVGYGVRFTTNDFSTNYGTHEVLLIFNLDKIRFSSKEDEKKPLTN